MLRLGEQTLSVKTVLLFNKGLKRGNNRFFVAQSERVFEDIEQTMGQRTPHTGTTTKPSAENWLEIKPGWLIGEYEGFKREASPKCHNNTPPFLVDFLVLKICVVWAVCKTKIVSIHSNTPQFSYACSLMYAYYYDKDLRYDNFVI